MEEECHGQHIDVPGVLSTILSEFSAVTDYRTLRDSLPQRLAILLKCRCVLLYQHADETLQFVAGSFADQPGWSSELLAVAHINPINLTCSVPEACAWRERRIVYFPSTYPMQASVPLIYRQRVIGVLTAFHGQPDQEGQSAVYWCAEESTSLEAIVGAVALLLENTRLLERDHARIHELSLLNSISNQINCSLYEFEHLRGIVLQRVREISHADLYDLLTPATSVDETSWITPALREMLWARFKTNEAQASLIIERPGHTQDTQTMAYLDQLPMDIKTFFALPLLSSYATGRQEGSLLQGGIGIKQEKAQEPEALGIIVGGYRQAWKLCREEEIMLQVLASQTSTVMENIALVAEVVEARNEARKLLRQVLDDQRLKELILASIPSGLITTDQHGHITTFNRAAEGILGYHPYEVLGQPLSRFFDLYALQTVPDTSATIGLLKQMASDAYNIARAQAIHGATVVTEDRQGQKIVLDVHVLPLHNNLGEPIGMLVTFTDVTSMHRLEEEKRRLDRLASLGEMAANVAHEVRNPLASIKTSMQMLKDDLASSDAEPEVTEQSSWAQTSIEVVLKEVERLDAIVRDMLLFARPRQLHRVKCDLVEICERVLDLLQAQCTAANVAVHRVFTDLPTIRVDIGQLEQILFNLCTNALQAMPESGVLTVTCQHIAADHMCQNSQAIGVIETWNPYSCNGKSELRYQKGAGGSLVQWVEIAVSDTGMGIPPEQLGRIFQPFFTTKAHGIGLGLAITRRLVEDHGGYIRVEGHFGYGATIIVRLPVVEGDDVKGEDRNER